MSARVFTSTARPSRALWVVIAAGVGLRVVLIVLGGPPERFEYDQMARNVLAGQGYTHEHLGTIYRSFYSGIPYMALTIATYAIAPDGPFALLVVQALVSAALALVVFGVARRLAGEGAALLAATLALAHPAFVYYDTSKLHPLGFDALAIAGAVLLLLRVTERPGAARAVGAGAVTGAAILQRGSVGLFFLFSLWWLARSLRAHPHRAGIVATYALGAALVVSPWVARNYAVHGVLLLESTMPQQFWKGNAAHSNGSGYLPSGRTLFEAAPQRLVDEWARRDEMGQYRLFRQEGLADVRRQPGRFATLLLRKLVYFWSFAPQSGALYPRTYLWLYLAVYLAMLAAASAGVVTRLRSRQVPDGLVLILLLFAALSIVHAVFFVEMRHRWAIEPMLLVLAAAGPASKLGMNR